MAEAKTKPTKASIDDYIAARASDEQRADIASLMKLLAKLTGEQPRMWGPSIVGYGSYHYKYDSGRTGESCATGFAIRGKELVVYLTAEGKNQPELLAKLGKHKMGRACLYFKRLSDLDQGVLERLVRESLSELRHQHPSGA